MTALVPCLDAEGRALFRPVCPSFGGRPRRRRRIARYAEGGEAIERNYQIVMDREHDADDLTREVLIAVRRSFITPFDRGNIRDLITSMDKISTRCGRHERRDVVRRHRFHPADEGNGRRHREVRTAAERGRDLAERRSVRRPAHISDLTFLYHAYAHG